MNIQNKEPATQNEQQINNRENDIFISYLI